MLMRTSIARVLIIKDSHPTTVGGASVRAAGAQRRHREAAAEEPILLRAERTKRARSALYIAAKLEGPPALIGAPAAVMLGLAETSPTPARGLIERHEPECALGFLVFE
jgi:hypothetical protein